MSSISTANSSEVYQEPPGCTSLRDLTESLTNRQPGADLHDTIKRALPQLQTPDKCLSCPAFESCTAHRDLLSAMARFRIEDEAEWAQRILGSPDPRQQYDNYLSHHFTDFSFTDREIAILTEHLGQAPRSIAFVGAGSMPVSPVLYAQRGNCTVHGIDCEEGAVKNAAEFARVLGYGDKLTFSYGDASDFKGYGRVDAVVIAVLVGLTPQEKLSIIEAMRQLVPEGIPLLVRNAHGQSASIFPSIGAELLQSYKFSRHVTGSELEAFLITARSDDTTHHLPV